MFILYHGSDTYRIRQMVDEYIAACRAQHVSLSVFLVDGDSSDAAEQLEHPLKYNSFFDEQKLIHIKHCATPAILDVLKQYDKKELAHITIIGTQGTTEKYDKKTLTALSKKADRCESFGPLTGPALTSWVRTFCKKRAVTIAPDAIRELVAITKTSEEIIQELEKLCAYAHGTVIDIHAVQALVPTRSAYDEWELSNAASKLDKRGTIVALWKKLHEGISEQLLIGSLASSLRTLSIVHGMRAKGQPAAAIAKRSGIHPFVISKVLRSTAKLQGDAVQRAHRELARLDCMVKDGRADAVDGLFDILLAL